MRFANRCVMALLAMVLCCLGTGCGEPTKLFALVGYNHTEHGIGSYIVTTSDGAWLEAGYLDTGQGGGGMMGTVSLPRKWKPGITVTITMSTVKNGQDIRVEKVVPVPRYDADANYFVVHFLHDGRYKVLVTGVLLGHREYPLTGKEAELEPGKPLEIIWE